MCLVCQTAYNDLQTRYDGLSDIISELETKAAITEQLQHDNSRLETHCHELRTQLQQKQRQLEDLTPKESALQNTSKIFSDHEDKRPLQYPVMQTNGLIVDHHRVISAWSKHGEDDDGYPYRNYICPVTKLGTSLARVNITLKIQEIATGLGMRLTPPIEFEYKGHGDSTWIKFGFMDQLSIVSKLCCMYNTGNQSSTIVLGNDQIYFNITLDKVSHRCRLSATSSLSDTKTTRADQGQQIRAEVLCPGQKHSRGPPCTDAHPSQGMEPVPQHCPVPSG
jgi:hypothetical protein